MHRRPRTVRSFRRPRSRLRLAYRPGRARRRRRGVRHVVLVAYRLIAIDGDGLDAGASAARHPKRRKWRPVGVERPRTGTNPPYDGSMYQPRLLMDGQSPHAVGLAALARNGRLVIYAGAGLSRAQPSDLPSGAQVARDT